MDYAEWLEMERERLDRDRQAFTGERPLAGWEIDGRKQYVPLDEQGTSAIDEIPWSYLTGGQRNSRGRVQFSGTLAAGNWFNQWTKDWPEECL